MQSSAELLARVLLLLAGAGVIGMACWPRGSRRFGALLAIVVVLGAGAQVISRGLAASVPVLGFTLGLIAFWLVDRGIPGNRPRPGWVRAFAALMALGGAAVCVAVLTGR